MGKINLCRTYLPLALLIAIFSLFISHSAYAEEGAEKCLTCHDDLWQDGLQKIYVHEPFQQQQCPACHVAGPTEEDKSIDRRKRSRIKWLGRNSNRSRVHWFEIPGEKRGMTLFIETVGQKTGLVSTEVTLPRFDQVQEYDNDNQAPVISRARVLAVERGLFFSATVAWDTDEAATSKVVFGLDGSPLSNSSALTTQLSRHHKVSLTNIKPNKTYKIAVVSEDVFGNVARSAELILSTSNTFAGADDDVDVEPLGSKIELTSKVYKKGDKYLLKIIADRRVTMAVGRIPGYRNIKAQARSARKGQRAVNHVVTNSKMVTNITVCYSCHTSLEEGVTHPVNVFPKGGMVIPPEYTTLPDGRMTCMSCHSEHGGNLEFRVIKSSKRQLCIGCHRDMI